ncbi:Rpn family recombination-promoting nuclease/putative transposase [Limosilactobacillus reuteri]|uniref:Rpn family recombination-promoting nuclease/putative transposase n=1 Tax=Limosilactobacillus reuteri TaxID=1598 RepID=UPI001E2F158F|nr:Rpn family recombination-promoting nuclease/putative transposase [Limosilactobacillus reuteri]MCC4325837.1 Rpn family recombination-promoting nuclease/putative transposase [Limosilactobacillus reuteri]MCC4330138.1 Rpn family recombination-promoting nuclease/putative transposase [Limosilactobacillus reuteri]MCC4351721.1 Rpn family recombination-promoting nuclease/putative transposase [Limosilactobacillus reuteri]MCC4376747.1 Rpn family recombination-promoting nuclease/putative transposase [Li
MNNLSREEQIALIYDKWQKMTITSDPMFGLVMQNKEICLELINRALPNLKAKEIIQLDTQKDISIVGAHRVRFDVYVRDDKNNIIVIEMQVNNQNNLPARLRYYQEQVDHGLLRPGDDYSVLKDYPTYVIMFCNFDYFKQGWARYEFNLTCTRDHNLKFGDNRTVVIFNALAKKFDKSDEPIKSFLALMSNQGDNKGRFIAQIQDEIDKVKQDPERRNGFMKYELNLMDAKREAREEGMAKAKREDIKKLIDSLYELNIKPAIVKQKVIEKYNLTDDEYDKFLG